MACGQDSVPADILEAQLAAYLTGFSLPDDYVETLVREYD